MFVSKLRQDFQRQIEELSKRYEKMAQALRDEMDLRRRNEGQKHNRAKGNASTRTHASQSTRRARRDRGRDGFGGWGALFWSVHEIEERKNLHIKDLIEKHRKAFARPRSTSTRSP